jgi:hypothetical protein
MRLLAFPLAPLALLGAATPAGAAGEGQLGGAVHTTLVPDFDSAYEDVKLRPK